jgi:hypothetical protein
MAMDQVLWWEPIKELDLSARQIDWTSHLARLNERYDLPPETAFSCSIPDWPPAWFTGNIEALQPGRWVLVVSINPAAPAPNHYQDHLGSDPWTFWTEHNRDSSHWNRRTKFFPRLADLSRTALELDPEKYGDEDVASEYMLFLEFCPYASGQFRGWRWDGRGGVQELANGDIGFAINRQIRQIAFLHGQPKLALLQGAQAAFDVKDYQDPGMIQDYVSNNPPYRIWKGEFRGYRHRTPIIGFPFLNSPSELTIDARLDLIREAISSVLDVRLARDTPKSI